MAKKVYLTFDNPEGVESSATVCGPGRTKQSFKDSCDVNKIVEKYVKSGYELDGPQALRRGQIFGNFSEIGDFLSMQGRLVAAREEFERLPAKLRRRFRNDYTALIQFLDDEGNLQEAKALGFNVEPASEPTESATKAAGPEAEPQGGS